MKLVLLVLGGIAIMELATWLPYIWHARRYMAGLTMLSLAAAIGALLAEDLAPWTVLIAILSAYRLINLLRLVENRINEHYLYHAARKTSIWLIAMQLAVILVTAGLNLQNITVLTAFYVLAAAQLLGGIIILASTSRHLKTTRAKALIKDYAERDLPTVTVAIPARNETQDLQDCLKTLVGNNYPKLEILVLDDCSQDRRTSEIIRGFAQSGVRFIAGDTPPESWLAKNYAYQRLAEEANGEVMVFCGVDCRFEDDSIYAIVQTLLSRNKKMLSILPRNILPSGVSIKPLMIQPSRYAWELALPRRLLQRPPVLSTCWAIDRLTLEEAGGFEAARRKIIPESYFAKVTAKSDAYSFLQANNELGLTSTKSYNEQLATSIRTRYPQLHKRPEMVAVVSLAEFTQLVWPLVIAVVAGLSREWPLLAISLLAFILCNYSHSRLVNLTYRRIVPGGVIVMPLAALYDVCLLNYSMWQYEFGQVIWKGRNICIPVMQAIPALPRFR